jgi:DNA-binding response OmpR family regulator
MSEKSILLAVKEGELRDELLLYFGHAGVTVYVTTDDKNIKDILRTKPLHCLIIQMNFQSFDALEILLDMRDEGIEVPVILLDLSDDHEPPINSNKINLISHIFEKPIKTPAVCEAADALLKRMVEHT